MNVNATDITSLSNRSIVESKDGATAEKLRQAAIQFEAVLLMQLTSALNQTSGDDEESLFGSDAGSGMAKQLFSEQMATSLAQSGGVGIAELIIQQVNGTHLNQAKGIKNLSEVISSVRGLEPQSQGIDIAKNPVYGLSSRTNPGANTPAVNGEAEVISTFEDDLRTNGIDEATRGLMLDGRVVNSTRARIVPGVPVIEGVGSGVVNSDDSAIAFQRPVNGRISSQFGNRFHPIDKTAKFHGGMDIAVPTGTPVSSAADGTVSFAGRRGGYGNLVIIDHPDGRQTRYAHLSSLTVSAGDNVSMGQLIALSGSTGKSTGPHLHFEVRENGQVVDPRRILSNVLPKGAEK